MSTDAGKVYFVLYLAVVLELLLVIMERDDAEEHLLKKQKESMKIVESILSQLQSGSGTEGINTKPQDEITIPPPGANLKEVMGADIKPWRKYIVEVGVTDVSSDLKQKSGESGKDYNQRLKKLVELSNVSEIEYQVFYSNSPNPDNPPIFPSDKEIKKKYNNFSDFEPGQTIDVGDGEFWEFLSIRTLILDIDATYNSLPLDNLTSKAIQPNYPIDKIQMKGDLLAPKEIPLDSIFYYSQYESVEDSKSEGFTTNEMKKRAFIVYFQPPSKQGWYKLRFSSRTNRILGVRADVNPEKIDQDTKINIGTVQLTVENLDKVKAGLHSKLERYSMPDPKILTREHNVEKFDKMLADAKIQAASDENPIEARSKIELYGYIEKLLAPGQSINFSQNRGAIEFNVRVITPKPPMADPVISAPTYIACFNKIPPAFEFTISPFQGKGINSVEARVMENGTAVARFNCTPLEEIPGVEVTPPTRGGRQEWRAIADQDLSPGKYTVEITHKLFNKPKTETAVLEIFPTGLTKSNKKVIDLKMNNTTLYGYKLAFNAIPTSGGKIKSNQFRMYLQTDQNQQKPPFEGLSMGRDEGLYLDAKSNDVSLMVSWIQPYTNKELILYPKKTVSIKQEAPQILTGNQSVQLSGTSKRIKIKVSNIALGIPDIGDDPNSTNPAKPTIKVKVQNPKVDITGYDIASDPIIEKDGNKYTITIEIRGKMQRGEDMLYGSVSCVMVATAINPMNGKSADGQKKINIPITYEPEKATGGRRRSGGAKPRPSGRRRR